MINDLSEKIINKIQQENIKPIPKWKFLFSEYTLWFLFVLNLLIVAISFGIIIYLFTNNDIIWDFKLVGSFLKWLIYAIPIFWILLTILLIIIGYFIYRNTQQGYRIEFIFLISLIIFTAVTLGLFIYFLGLAFHINNYFSQKIPYYNQFADLRNKFWQAPTEGRLAGIILSKNEQEKSIEIQDLNGTKWKVNYSDAKIRPNVKLNTGNYIKIIGNIENNDTNQFKASEIRPWNGKKEQMQENFRHMRNNK